MPWTLPVLIGPEGVRTFRGTQARQLVYQEAGEFLDVCEDNLSYIWQDDVVCQHLDLANPTHLGVVAEEVRTLTSTDPSWLTLDGLLEPIARAISFMACCALVKVYDTQRNLGPWVSVGTMIANTEYCVQLVLDQCRREQPYWIEKSRKAREARRQAQRYVFNILYKF